MGCANTNVLPMAKFGRTEGHRNADSVLADTYGLLYWIFDAEVVSVEISLSFVVSLRPKGAALGQAGSTRPVSVSKRKQSGPINSTGLRKKNSKLAANDIQVLKLSPRVCQHATQPLLTDIPLQDRKFQSAVRCWKWRRLHLFCWHHSSFRIQQQTYLFQMYHQSVDQLS